MNHLLPIWLCAILLSSCNTQKQLPPAFRSDDLLVKEVAKNTFVHISYLPTESYGKVACNGMVYFNGEEAIIFDTPTNDQASLDLISWVKLRGKQVKALVVTHFHEDCLGGMKAFHEEGIKSWANQSTIEILKKEEAAILPEIGFGNSTQIKIGKEEVKLIYFGEGHTRDNIVGYIPSKEALFGGCLVKSLGAGKGYLGDANTEEWSNTVKKIKTTYPKLKVVIPGHGKPGGVDLLDFTIEMFGK